MTAPTRATAIVRRCGARIRPWGPSRRLYRRVVLLVAILMTGCLPPDAAIQTPPPAQATATGAPVTRTPPARAPAASVPTTLADPRLDLARIDTLEQLSLPRRDLVALAYAYGLTRAPTRVVRTQPLADQEGRRTVFWVWDGTTDRYYTTTATLQLAREQVLMYVEDGVPFNAADLEQAARTFDEQIYPRTRARFGSEWTPGIDGDPRITILNARLRGAGGYHSIADEVPRGAMRFSNERDMFFMNLESFPLASPGYYATLAHEFQHLIAMPQQQDAETWLNEGLSNLAAQLNGYTPNTNPAAFLDAPDLQLTTWGDKPGVSRAHYAASYLFMAYVYERTGSALNLQALVQSGAGRHLTDFARQVGRWAPDVASFDALVADWAVANLLNDPTQADGRWSYPQLPRVVQPVALSATELLTDVAQYGADYWALPAVRTRRAFAFDGADAVGLVPTDVLGNVAWWSNGGEDVVTTLTGEFDLSGLQTATLAFRVWYDLQREYDYGFVSASTDGGTTWRTLRGRHTTAEDPLAGNYGHGYTGASGAGAQGWRDEVIDLTPVAGQRVLVRFSMVTEDSAHHVGMLIDDIRIPELGFGNDAEEATGVWQPVGWVRTDNRLPQRWEVRLVRWAAGSGARAPTVEPIALDGENRATIQLAAGERAVLVVLATTPFTTERAGYTLRQQQLR